MATANFAGHAGEEASFGIQQQDPDWLRIALAGPDKQTVMGVDIVGNRTLTATLPMDGMYSFTLSPNAGLVSLGRETRDLDLTLTLSEREHASIAINGPPLPLTTRPGQLAEVSFSGKASQQVSLGIQQQDPDWFQLTLFGPNGQTVTGGDIVGNRTVTATLPIDGAYTFLFSPDAGLVSLSTGARALDQTLTLSEHKHANIAIDGTSLHLTTCPGQLAEVSFSGKASQQVSLEIQQQNPDWLRATLISPDGQTVTGEEIPGNKTFAATLPIDGTYTFLFSPDVGLVSLSTGARALDLTLMLKSSS